MEWSGSILARPTMPERKRQVGHEDHSMVSFLSSQNVLSHAGEWVAILDRTVLAAGPNLLKVYAAAEKKAKGRKPYYYAVPGDSQIY